MTDIGMFGFYTMMKTLIIGILAIFVPCMLISCASMEDRKKTAEVGAAAGAVFGGIIGHQSGRAAEGAALGAAGGAMIGYGGSKVYGQGLDTRRRHNEAQQQGNLDGPMN